MKDKPTTMANWIRKLLEKKPFRIVFVALANKLARIAWAVLAKGRTFEMTRRGDAVAQPA